MRREKDNPWPVVGEFSRATEVSSSRGHVSSAHDDAPSMHALDADEHVGPVVTTFDSFLGGHNDISLLIICKSYF